LIASALIFSQWMIPHLGFPGTLFLCAVMLGALYGGVGPGLLAATLSALAFHYYFQHFNWCSIPVPTGLAAEIADCRYPACDCKV
jgi:K+-sensing histidine kinase KdpD